MSSEPLRCTLRISVEIDEQTANYVMDAISVEFSNEPEMPRCEVWLEYNENTLHLTINSKDLSSLRAAVNSYLRWLNLAIEGACLSSKKFSAAQNHNERKKCEEEAERRRG